VVRSNPCKGPVYPEKGPKKSQRAKQKFWGQKVLFGTKSLKFGPKGQPGNPGRYQWRAERGKWDDGPGDPKSEIASIKMP